MTEHPTREEIQRGVRPGRHRMTFIGYWGGKERWRGTGFDARPGGATLMSEGSWKYYDYVRRQLIYEGVYTSWKCMIQRCTNPNAQQT